MTILMESFQERKHDRRGPPESRRERVPVRNCLTAGLIPAGRVGGGSG